MENIKPVYLVMVTPDNHNKYYRMTPNNDGFTVEYGRVGASFQTASYPLSQWNKKYNEKIKKGYIDQTRLVSDLIVKTKNKSSEYTPIDNKAVTEIVERLQMMAKKAIKDNYTISSNQVTQAMVDEAQCLLVQLMGVSTADDFNETLIRLFSTIPRKMGKVINYLAKSNSDFSKIIQTEQDLLDVMRGQVVQHTADEVSMEEDTNYQTTILEAFGLQFSPVTYEEEIKIKSCLGSCSDKYYQAWKVVNNKTQKKFDNFMKTEENIKTKLLWHGSRNENWWSIINSGLVLKPTNAVITGKMFGYGIYFASKARKSLGYTSISGSYWAKGSSSSAFMALYNVAYGKAYDVYDFDSQFYNLNYEKLQGFSKGTHCLHAHEGKMLRNDEIIVYKEEQTTVQYLVELK